jgi:hypothetical protein
MPPRPPNFLPANRRRRLDPSRHLRSRELWNRVRYFSLSPSSAANNSNNNKLEWMKAYLHAIAYECQPFPILPALQYVTNFVRNSIYSDDNNTNNSTETGLARFVSTIYESITSIILFTTKSTQILNVATITSFIITNKFILYKSTIILIALLLYHRTLLYLHDLLAIGPLVLIVTLLTVLYTVGLGDNTGATSGIPSAYSVFNKGMARLLGTIDGEELARQYAGGGGGGGGGAAAMAVVGVNDTAQRLYDNNNLNEEDEVWEEWIDEEEIVNERRRQRRLERLRRRPEHDDDANNDSNNADEDEDYDLDDTREDYQRQESAAAAAAAAGAAATRKKSGKKARRKDLDLRREMQQQRRAAAAMGFGVGDELAVEDIREIEARFALLE